MLRFYANRFIAALEELEALRVLFKQLEKGSVFVNLGTDEVFQRKMRDFEAHVAEMKLVTTLTSVRRLTEITSAPDYVFDEATHGMIGEIQGRLRDELDAALLFAIRDEAEYFDPPSPLFGAEVNAKFPSVSYEIEEAGKCYALGRYTATVFHLMRTLETGVDALAKCLGIPDPIKNSDKTWGAILRNVKNELTRRATAGWTNAADKQFFDEVYASLDAVRTAARNPVMHVERKYVDYEAEDIFTAVRGLMRKVASRMDENGRPPA
jgi:hypothetical protein